MRIAVIGSGGREHAIIWKLRENENIKEIYALPGNAGIGQVARCVNISVEDISGICEFSKRNNIDMVVVGPEVPLAMGLVDELERAGIRAFGPNRKCAELEASKAFTKAFLKRHKIPTAEYREYTDIDTITNDIGIFGFPMVIKADGLAAGKGVVIAETEEEAKNAIRDMMEEKIFGDAGNKIVVEECLVGIEASCLCFVDENTIIPMASAQDYKRAFDGDRGLNTGGMGTYSPSLMWNDNIEKQVMETILKPTLQGFKKDGLNFKGVLFVGLMLTDNGPKVIEFNNRFGDPETQSVLPRLESDLYDIFDAVIDNRLSEIDIRWKDEKAICVVMASGGYPEKYEKGLEIFGLDNIDNDVILFHAGTKLNDEGKIVTNGGRVLCVTALAPSHEEARAKVYANIGRIKFKNAHYRKDIGLIVSK